MTTDPNDRASEQEEQMRNAAMRFKRPEGPAYRGSYCLHCEDDIDQPGQDQIGRRWCAVYCRDEWEKAQR